MFIKIACIGRLKASAELELCNRYSTRSLTLIKPLGFRGLSLHEQEESKAASAPQRQNEEMAFLKSHARGRVIALSEEGRNLTSPAFAQLLATERDKGTEAISFMIGGADGLHKDLRQDTLAFGAITLPHQLARAILLEQIYRAMTILSNHPYHRV
jgi:23S rRNA (pseudouridine1915-N3)-methyltransferase